MDLQALTVEAFEPLRGQAFTLHLADATLPLELREVRRLRPAADGQARTPFSLLFAGPPAPLLAQHIYPLEHGTLGTLELFLVPLGPRDGGLLYEAVFA